MQLPLLVVHECMSLHLPDLKFPPSHQSRIRKIMATSLPRSSAWISPPSGSPSPRIVTIRLSHSAEPVPPNQTPAIGKKLNPKWISIRTRRSWREFENNCADCANFRSRIDASILFSYLRRYERLFMFLTRMIDRTFSCEVF